MRDAGEVTVQRVIVHKIDHIEPKNTVLSEIDLELDVHATLRDYFNRQVANALGDENTRAAKFVGDDDSQAKDECFAILAKPGSSDSFVAASRKLANLLQTAMANDNRIALGSLAVCIYTASNYQGLFFLALIKLDPGDALVQTIDEIGGKKLVTFDVQSNVMPTARERLHKAALIAPPGVEPKYDLLLLDTQGTETAAFFAKKFLHTIPAFDTRTTTEAVLDAINRARTITSLTREESLAVQDWIPAAFTEEKISIAALVRRLPLPAEKKKVFRKEIETMLPGEQVLELDPELAKRRLLRKTRFRGDFGVRFEVFSQNYNVVVTGERKLPPDKNGTVITRVTLEVPNLEWIK